MKRYAPFLLLALILAACTVRFDADLVVNEDESGTFTLFLGLDEQLAGLAQQFGGEDLDLSERIGAGAESWTTEEVEEDGFKGTRVATEFDDFDDLEAKLTELSEGSGGGLGTEFLSRFELTHEGDDFHFEADISGVGEVLTDVIGETEGAGMIGALDSDTIAEIFEIRFRLSLPGTIGDNNADTVSGGTLTWNLDLADDAERMVANSTLGGSSSALLFGGGAVAIAAIAGIGIAAMRRRKGNVEKKAVANAGNF